MYNSFRTHMDEHFLAERDNVYVDVHITWGIDVDDPIDRSKFVRWLPNENRGTANFYENLEMYNTDSLKHVLEVCHRVQSEVCDLKACQPPVLTNGQRTLAIPNRDICWVKEFFAYSNVNLGNYTVAFPNKASFLTNLDVFRKTQKPQNYDDKTWETYIGIINGELKYSRITYKSTMKLLRPHDVRGAMYEKHEEMVFLYLYFVFIVGHTGDNGRTPTASVKYQVVFLLVLYYKLLAIVLLEFKTNQTH